MKNLRLATFLPYQLSVTTNKISDLIGRAYVDILSLSRAQWRVLAVLGEEAGLTSSQVAAKTAQDKVTVTRAVKGLIADGHVRRQASQSDGRVAHLNLTAKGRRAYDQVAPAALQYEKALLSALTQSERKQLTQILSKLDTAVAHMSS
ncbi:MAG: MarR family winged helix-turn-helix transcriptional regulator [Pseudomonadota bacterium]